jgi:hypothetical protein
MVGRVAGLGEGMDALKGQGKVVAFATTGADRLTLVIFPDDSWGILQNGKVVCVWEPAEAADCIHAFAGMSGATADMLEFDPHMIARLGMVIGPDRKPGAVFSMN